MSKRKYDFDFTAMPKCIVTNKLVPDVVRDLKDDGRMLFLILNATASDMKNIDSVIHGYFMACGVERSEYVAVFFNDLGIPYEDARDKFIKKWNGMKFPDSIEGQTSLALNKNPNLLSSFLKDINKIA